MTQGTESVRFGKSTTDTVLQRFEQWARDTPDGRAVIAGYESFTYAQLDTRANQLAHHLLASGLPPGGIVAVGTTRQAELLVALLAVLKAGGVYAVIDVDTPRTGQRQLTALEPFALLTRAAQEAALDDGSGLRVIRIEAEADAIAALPAEPPQAPAPGGTAAILFTGGAHPRPVPVTHARLLAAYRAWAEVARLTPEDRHLITAGAALTDFAAGWTRALCSGGTLVLPVISPWKPDDILKEVESERVSVLYTDPVGADRLVVRGARPAPGIPRSGSALQGNIRSLRLLALTGDRVFLDELDALHTRLRPGVRVLDVYGLTETAGVGTHFELPQLRGPLDDLEGLSLLGIPFPGCRVHLHDGEIRLTPPDGGDAVPTGDLGALRPDGLLEFRGRIRDRIALADRVLDPYPVETAIRSHPGVGRAMVTAVTDDTGVERLVAYLAPPPGDVIAWDAAAALPEIQGLRDHLAGVVLREETPRTVIRMRALPRNRAGQEDRTALPLPARHLPEGVARPSKFSGATGTAEGPGGCAFGCMAAVLGFVALLLTNVLWPGSTDLTGVPFPWAPLFFVLYLCEVLAFGAGVLFLINGHRRMKHRGLGPRRTRAAHLAVCYLLLAWWPQDNFYRLAAKHDWPQQALLVYTFNIPLMVAGLIVALFLARKPDDPFHFDPGEDTDA
ncbi:class I adenylate-forming enzyme family protein [Streptomyces sp. NPDC096339]|uniref:class I adenylate-forming enzyme family protein n=1 Tax=Streptomyces sp. NPDC096339 TaxID=3366086 RepID=UPI00380469B0